ncbi:MerR family transcriptional regulator [Micromonospora sp. I033]
MQISQIASRAGVSTKAVRYYEGLGLIAPRRLPNGYRDYDEHDVRVVREIKTLTGLGVAAEQCRPFVECLSAGHDHGDDCPASLAGYRDAIDDLTRRISGLVSRRDALLTHLHTAANRGNHMSSPGQTGDGHMTDLGYLPSELPVPEDDGATAHVPGLPMPPLGLTATNGDQIALDRLAVGRTVIYLYPLTGRPGIDLPDGWDAIPGARGCTPEACAFRDHHRDLLDAGATAVYGLSSQTTEYQSEVVERLHLPFAMLSDPTFALAEALRLPTFDAGGQRLYKRQTLIVRDGEVEHVFYPIFPPHEHAAKVLDWLTSRSNG